MRILNNKKQINFLKNKDTKNNTKDNSRNYKYLSDKINNPSEQNSENLKPTEKYRLTQSHKVRKRSHETF